MKAPNSRIEFFAVLQTVIPFNFYMFSKQSSNRDSIKQQTTAVLNK